jgi:dTDP-glucose pyrophosphorylase
MTLGIVPAAGVGSRIQPLAFSKELLPVGSRLESGVERPRAVSEYLVERMILGGATRICFVIAPTKSDIIEYYGGEVGGVPLCYVVQQEPRGLCDALFSACGLAAPGETVLVGLPDTIWFPEDGFARLPDDALAFLCFPVEHPERFDAVIDDGAGAVREIRVKAEAAGTPWVWGAFKMRGCELDALAALWHRRARADRYVGTLVNAYLAEGHEARAVRAGQGYVDVGTLHGYRDAIRLLDGRARGDAPRPFRAARAAAE